MRAIVSISMLFGMAIDFRVRFDVDDVQLSQLHHDAFGGNYELVPWGSRLQRHSKSWVGAFHGTVLCEFMNADHCHGRHRRQCPDDRLGRTPASNRIPDYPFEIDQNRTDLIHDR
jgi:hypothetical protein